MRGIFSSDTAYDVQVMYKLDGQGQDRNVFRNSFSNILSPPEGAAQKTLAVSFALAVRTVSNHISGR